MPAQYKLNQANQIINRTNPLVMMDEITSILQGLIDDGEYVKDWTAPEIAQFVLEVIEKCVN